MPTVERLRGGLWTSANVVAAVVAVAPLVCLVPLVPPAAMGQQEASNDAPGSSAPAGDTAARVEAASVNGQAIYADEVERAVERVTQGRQIDPETRDALLGRTLARLIDQRLILQFLAQAELAASQQEIDLEISRLEKRLQQQGEALEDYLRRAGIDQLQLQHQFAWQIGWGRLLKRYLNDDNLQKYFERHRRDFDGTQVHVAHILLKAGEGSEGDAKAQAARIRERIASGNMTFADAARQHSAAPTAADGGDIGTISRHEPMPEPFSRAAFALEPGEISPPVVSPFGVHLIKCIELKPGTRSWQDARAELQRAVTEYLFQWAADRQRPAARINFSGKLPYYSPQTGELIK